MADRSEFDLSPPSTDVLALVARLSAAEAALEKSLGLGADAVVDSRGHAHLLRQAQMALQQSENRFRTLIENSADVIALVAADGTVLYNSPAVARVLGYAPAELRGHSFLSLFHPEDRARATEVFAELTATPRTEVTVALRYRHKNGAYRWLEGMGTNLLDQPGVNAVVLNYRDVTERKRSESTAIRLAAIVESSDDAIIGKDLNGVITTWNPGAEKIFGYAASEMLETSINRLIPADRRDEEKQILGKISHGERVAHFETQRQCKDGRLIDVSVTTSPIRDVVGKVIGASKVARDITERKQAEGVLKLFRDLVQDSSDAIGMATPEGNHYYQNATFDHLFGEIGQNPPDSVFVDPVLGRKVFDAIMAGGIWQGEVQMFGKDRAVLEILLRTYPIKDQAGQIVGLVGLHTDITERKQAEKARRHSEAELKESQRIAQIGSWEWTPTTGVIAWSDGMNHVLARAPGSPTPTFETLPQFYTPESWQRLGDVITRALETGAPYTLELEMIRSDGANCWTTTRGEAIRGTDGTVVKLRGTVLNITELKKADAALRQSEELYRSLFANMLNGYAYCRMIFSDGRPVDFVPLMVNRSFTTLLGLKDVVGKNASVVIPGLHESDPELLEVFGRVELSGVPEHFEHFGKILGIWLSISVYSPAKEHVVVIFDVITERKKAEAALRESEERFRSFFDHAPIGKCITALDGKFLRVNQAFGAMLGYSVEELQTMSFASITHPDDLTMSLECARALLAGERDIWAMEKRYRTKAGSYIWAHVTMRLLRDDRGRPLHFLTDILNISDAKAAEVALRESEERYRLLFENNPLSMWVYDPETLRFLAVNQSAVEHYGYTRMEFLAMTVKDIRPKEDTAALLHSVEEGRAEIKSTSEWRHRRKDGAIIQVEIISRPLVFDGRHARLVLANDITEKKLLEEKFLHAQRLESIGMLAAGIAHDLNNVLAPIMFAGALLRGSLSSPRDLNILDTIEQSGRRGAGLVKQILGFVHNTTGEFHATQVKHLLRDIISLIEETFPKSIQLEHQIPTKLWPVLGNATQIHQVLLNLCVNARDAMPSGGTLRIVAANRRLNVAEAGAIPGGQAGAWLMLEVTDTGTGIAPEVLERIWTPFFTTKVIGKGTGLGLSTVRGIVANHHGFVEVQTAVGRGSTFRVYLPAIESETPVAKSTSPFAIPDGCGEFILVVEDDKSIRDIVANILEQHGYRVMSCTDGVEAITLFTAHSGEISAVLTDVDMPRLGGVALVRALLQLRPDIRLLAMSGLSRSGTESSDIPTIQTLAHGFLHKPFTPEALLGAVHRLLHLTECPRTVMPSILLIDDDDLFRQSLADALTEQAYTVTQAADGAAGVKLFRAAPTDLVLTDIVMPNQEGLETIKTLRRDHPKLGIIAMSGGLADNAPLYLKVAGALGANRTLPKPFNLPTLMAAITDVLAEIGKGKPAS